MTKQMASFPPFTNMNKLSKNTKKAMDACTSEKFIQETAACNLMEITPEMKKKYFAPKIAAGDFDRLAGTPLTIKRTGGGCT
jgi:hypothetical protein